MATKKIHLTGCQRLNYQNKLYVKKDQSSAHPIYKLDADLADYLLTIFDQSTGFNFFEPYTGTEEGVLPSGLDDDRERVTARGPKPPERERGQREERVSRQTKLKQGNAPIEDDTGVPI